MSGRLILRLAACGSLLATLGVVSGCGGTSSSSPAPKASKAASGDNLLNPRCKLPSGPLMDKIGEAVASDGAGATGIGNAMAVRSRDYNPPVWFVSAVLKPNSAFDGDIATWAVHTITTANDLLFSADSFAEKFSGMGRAPVEGGGHISFTDEGGQISRECTAKLYKANPHDFWPVR